MPLTKIKYNWCKRNYQYRLLIFGIMLTGFGVYQLPVILTFKSNLVQIKGTLRTADTYITSVTDRRGHSSQKSELIFYLNEQQQKYYFAENIGDDYSNEKYEKILQGLNRADSITIWIRKSEVGHYEPKVFQIENEKTRLLDFKSIRESESPITVFLLLIGIGSITAFLWMRFPDTFNKIIETN